MGRFRLRPGLNEETLEEGDEPMETKQEEDGEVEDIRRHLLFPKAESEEGVHDEEGVEPNISMHIKKGDGEVKEEGERVEEGDQGG